VINPSEATPMAAALAPRPGLRALGWVFGLVGVLSAFSIWILLSHVLAGGGGVINRLPGPALVAEKLLIYAKGDLGQDLISSLKVFLVGWLTAVACATVVGILLGRVRVLGAMFMPLVEAIRPV
jgi:ABC-type nitrate/sulfonate/bicarbonate transport system permease component